MKVISIGRSNDNDVRIDDLYVGRHHCQIVQHDNGTYTIVDMNSRNGTFVNGRRIFGEVQLQPYDSVTIGHTNLPWRSYFTRKTKPYTLPIVLGSVGGVLLTIVLTLLIFRHGSDKTFAFKGEYPDAVVVNMIDEDGTPYTIEAIEGQVCVWFKEGVPYKTAKQSIEASEGRIVAQIPENGYYLVNTPTDKVQVFVNRITRKPNVDWAYPNMLSYPCVVNNFILDNFYPDKSSEDTTPHGAVVRHAIQEYSSDIALRTFNIGNENGFNLCTSNKLGNGCVNSEFFALDTISKLNNKGPIFINMSYGPSLPKREKPNGDPEYYYWDEATDKEKEDYQIGYRITLQKTIMNLRLLEGKDYVVVVAAGNDGVKSFDEDIISYLRDERTGLTEHEKEVMDKHFILVSAGEDKFKKYSNEMEAGHYDPWVTKMDISDFKYNNKRWYGTSFAAPRTAGILSSVANETNLTGAEVLKYAKKATLLHPEHLLTKEGLMKQILNRFVVSMDQIKQDIVGVVIKDPSPQSYFPDSWSWTIKSNEIVSVTIKQQTSSGNNQQTVDATIRLKRRQMLVDVDVVLYYKKANTSLKFEKLTVQKISFPSQQDYSSYVKIYMDYDFMPSLVVKNTSNMALFVAGSYTSRGETTRFSAELEAHESKTLGIGPTPDSYRIHFAYKE